MREPKKLHAVNAKLDRLLYARRCKRNLLLSFFLPALFLGVALAARGVLPFGDRMILAHDQWHQYYPFYVEFCQRIKSGGSLMYTQSIGLGTNYLPLFAYYLASPLNLLCALAPESWLMLLYTLQLLIKVGCAGGFFALYLKIVYKKEDCSLPMFSMLFALSSFVMGYYWNLMWLDTLALLPLIMAGFVSLLRDGKWKLYAVSLAVAVWSNYYIAIFVCIFVALSFLGYTICRWNGWKGFFVRLGKLAAFSLLGVGVAAVLLLPAYLNLQNTYSSINRFPTEYAINIGPEATLSGTLIAVKKVLSNSLDAIIPTSMTGLPNIACGVSTILLGVYYCLCKKIPLRERIFNVCLLLFFIASFIIRQLDYVWHGLHFPNSLPHRFSFLYCFVLISMAARAYYQLGRLRPWHVAVQLLVFAGLIWCALDEQLTRTLLVSALAAAVLLLGLLLISLRKLPRRWFSLALVCVVLAECACMVHLGVNKVGTTSGATYPRNNDATQALLSAMREREEDSLDFYRAETVYRQCLNDAPLNGYDGISVFSSTCNYHVTALMRALGLSAGLGSNRYTYMESSPFTNLMLNLKYLVSNQGDYTNATHFSVAARAENALLLENNYYLPMGFVTKPELAEYETPLSGVNSMQEQQKLFTLATGLTDELYRTVYPESVTLEGGTKLTGRVNYSFSAQPTAQTVTILFRVTSAEPLCLRLTATDVSTVRVTDDYDVSYTRNIKKEYLMCLGSFPIGDTVKVEFTLPKDKSGTIVANAAYFNNEAFAAGYEILSRSTMQMTERSDTQLSGTIDVQEDGLFYTSIPYEAGWTAEVDGEAVEITPVGDALIAFPITAGTHTVTLRFRTPGLTAGLCISIGCVLTLLAIAVLERRRALAKRTNLQPEIHEE